MSLPSSPEHSASHKAPPTLNLAAGHVNLTPVVKPQGHKRHIGHVSMSPEHNMDEATLSEQLASIKADTVSIRSEQTDLKASIHGYQEIIDHQDAQIKALKTENQNLNLSQKVILGRLIRVEAKAEQQAAEIVEMKSRMMRDNIIIKTKDKKYKAQPKENTETKIKAFMKDELKVDVQGIKITRAHRMGRATENNNSMMIAKLPYASDHAKIFGNVKALAGTDNIISKQYPTEVEERRHFAWSSFKKEKAAGKAVRFDHTGRLFVDNVHQSQFDHQMLPPFSAAAFGAGKPEMISSKSDIHYVGNHCFQAHIYRANNREEVATARDLLFSDIEAMDQATHIPYAYRLNDNVQNFDSDNDYYAGTSLLATMKQLKLEGVAAFILHHAPAGKTITMKQKRDIFETTLKEAMEALPDDD